jgi:hypothetical protein
MHLLNHIPLARQRIHQLEHQMNFHLWKLMNCPMWLGLSNTTCLQWLREQNPIKVVFVSYDSEPSHSCSRLCPLFLLVCYVSEVLETYCKECLHQFLISKGARTVAKEIVRRGTRASTSWTSRSSKNNHFPYVFHQLVVSCKFRSIFLQSLYEKYEHLLCMISSGNLFAL